MSDSALRSRVSSRIISGSVAFAMSLSILQIAWTMALYPVWLNPLSVVVVMVSLLSWVLWLVSSLVTCSGLWCYFFIFEYQPESIFTKCGTLSFCGNGGNTVPAFAFALVIVAMFIFLLSWLARPLTTCMNFHANTISSVYLFGKQLG